MATSPMSAYRVAEAKFSFRVSVMTWVALIEPTSPETDIEDGRGAARGILVGLVLCVPFWVGVYSLLF